MTPVRRAPILPQRVRTIGGQSFAFLPHRFLRAGFFASLAPDELRLYVLLVLAADRHGLSFYHYDSLCALLEIPLESYLRARNALIEEQQKIVLVAKLGVSPPDDPKQFGRGLEGFVGLAGVEVRVIFLGGAEKCIADLG